MSGVTL